MNLAIKRIFAGQHLRTDVRMDAKNNHIRRLEHSQINLLQNYWKLKIKFITNNGLEPNLFFHEFPHMDFLLD
jgi:hypothetical protein